MKILSNTQTKNHIKVPSKKEKTDSFDNDCYIPREIGAEKETTQHVSNTGFGISSLFAVKGDFKNLFKITSKSRLTKHIPFLNIGVAAIEGYHTAKFLREGENVVAATCAGNAAGCAGSVLEEAAAAAAIGGQSVGALKFAGIALGIIGGALGIAAGTVEIKEGLKIRKAGGSKRTFTMGVLDITSGITSMTGGVLMATGLGGPVGVGLLVTAGVCDLAGIGVDYLWKRHDKKEESKKAENKEEITPQKS